MRPQRFRRDLGRLLGPGCRLWVQNPGSGGSPENEPEMRLLPYQSPGIANGIKLSPQDPRPSSPVALQMTGERGSEKVRVGRGLCGALGRHPEPGILGHARLQGGRG